MIRKLLESQLKRNMASGAVLTAVNSIASFVAYPVYLYYLGADTFGLWLLLAVVIQFARLGMLGIPEAITKLVAEEQGRESTSGIERCVTSALFILCASGFFIAVSVFLLRRQIVGVCNFEPAHLTIAMHYLPLLSLLSAYILVVEMINAVLSGLGRIDLANLIRSAGRLVVPTVAIVLLTFGLGLKSLLIGNAAGYCVIHIASLTYVRKMLNIRFMCVRNWDRRWATKILNFGGGISGISLIAIFLTPFNKLMLARYAGIESVPVYEIGYRLAMQMRSVFQMLFQALLPEISRLCAKRTTEACDRIRRLNWRSLLLIVVCALPAYIVLMLTATPLLKFWLGQGYITGMSSVLKILLVATFFSLLCVPSYFILLGMGFVKVCLFSSIIQSGVNVSIVMGIVFTGMPLSLYYVAWAVLAGMALTSMFLIVQARRNMRWFEEELNSVGAVPVRTSTV